jgi:hypothetical protein
VTTELSEQQHQFLAQLTPLASLDNLVPPMLEEAIGYGTTFMGNLPMMRYVAFYWERCGDEVIFDDGATSATGNWHQFLLYVQHRRIRPHLRTYDFGSSEDEPVHYLILDRDERKLFVAPTDLAGAFLQAQQMAYWQQQPQKEEPGPMVVNGLEDLMNLVKRSAGWHPIEISQEQVAVAMQRDRALYVSLYEWLEQQETGERSVLEGKNEHRGEAI